jgi:4-amino-4-deoxy-L-arabinose transferase-like glycosyltransferase
MSTTRWTLHLTVALLALVLRLAYLAQISSAPFVDLRIGDARAYHEWATRIANGDWLGKDVFYQAPLYPYFLAIVYKIVGDGPTMVRFIHAVIGAGSCVLIGAAGMALFGTWGIVAGFLLAIYAPAIFLDGLLEKTALVSFFTAALLFLLAVRPFKGREFLAGVVLGLLALTRENALLLAVPLVLWFLTGDRRRGSWLPAAAFLLGGALVLAPVGLRNYAVGGEFHLSTSQFGPNFYIGNHAGAAGLYEPLVTGHGNASDERDDATRLAEEASQRKLSPGEVSAYWTGRALDFIKAQPGTWLALLGRKLALTYNYAEIADTESQDVYAESAWLLRVLTPPSFGVILCLAAFGVVSTARDWRRLWFLYAIAIAYTISILTFYVFARYRFPLVPVLMLLAAGGLAASRDAHVSRRARGWALVAAIVVGVVTFLPLVNRDVDRVAHYVNVANTLSADSRRWDQAKTFYDKALAVSPQSPAAHYGLGMLLAQQHQPKDAVAHYRIAIVGWPQNIDLRLNFALALAASGDDAGAAAQVEIAKSLSREQR